MSRDASPEGKPFVLIFEDDHLLADMMSDEIRDMGYAVGVASDTGGLDQVRRREPIVIFLDVSLGQTDGVEVLQALDELGAHCPVQLMSGCQPGMLDRVKRIGERRGMSMLPVLHKPFDVGELQIIVNEAARAIVDRGEFGDTVNRGGVEREVDLGLALDKGWVEVWYQPKYDIETLSLVGAECLCRVRHPDHGVIGPNAVLPRAGMDDMRRLTELVLHRACEDWSVFKEAGLGLRLAINIPCALLTTMPLAKLLRQWQPQAPDWPGLILEVTEEQVLRDIDAAFEIGTQLAIYGVEFAIDDFGTGYSSLSRLREIPFKEIKLDRTLVDGCADDEVRAALCRTVIELSHAFGAVTVGEGVERIEDLTFLRDIGCDVAQGFLLARPMTRDALAAALQGGEKQLERLGLDHGFRLVA